VKIKADSNPGRSFIPMVVPTASGFIFWRCFFVFKPVSNRFKNRRTAPLGSYYPIVKMRNSVSELKNILPLLRNRNSSGSIINKESPKTRYHFLLSGGIIEDRI
jgi:hypothetical protein